MGFEKLMQIVAFITIWAAATGQLPKMVMKIQVAQLKLLKASQSKTWGKALQLQ